MSRHRISSAWPLAGLYTSLIVYASLYPFTDWRSQGIPPWAFFQAPWPRYWTGFDVLSNLLGYIPVGMLLALAAFRTGWRGWSGPAGVLLPCCLSLLMEAGQTYLPQRVPSDVDWLLNTAGAAIGAGLALLLLRLRVLGSWEHFHEKWLVQDTQGALLLLLLWPFATLYPAPVPFGLGQFLLRLDNFLRQQLEGTPFLAWLPQPEQFPPLSLLMQALLVGLCVWAPLLLLYAVCRHPRQRVPAALGFAAVAVLSGALSAAMTYGPEHAWDWLSPPVWSGLLLAAGLAVTGMFMAHRTCALFSLLAWGFVLGVLNRSPDAAYFAESLDIWEQGRFIRFHGLSQWLGWLWPCAALWVAGRLALRRA